MCMISPAGAAMKTVALPFAPIVWLVDKFRMHRVKVSRTRIFARHDGDHQFVVYSMRLSTPAESVMVLPIPAERGLPEAEALEFIDLSDYPDLFDDLNESFQLVAAPSRGGPVTGSFTLPTLKVHEVGAYDASFVPTLGDFDRLDARFRFPDQVWEALPEYADYSFAVFKLSKGRDQEFHPMAFRFRTRESSIFFPTVHVHDGTVHSRADFAHDLFLQLKPDESADRGASRTITRNGAADFARRGAPGWENSVDFERSQGVVDPGQDIFKVSMYGEFDNEDVRIVP